MRLVKLFLKLMFVFSTAYFLLFFSISVALNIYFRRIAKESVTINDVMVEIPYGTSLRRLTNILFASGLITKPEQFYWYLRVGRNDANRIQAGFYHFVGTVSHHEIAHRLLFGRDRSFPITFKEGETLKDLSAKLETAGLVTKSDFLSAMTSKEIIDLVGAPNAALRTALDNDVGGIEGYLFPDTYFFTKHDNAKTIIKRMHAKLLEVFDDAMKKRMAELGMSLHELLTLASIVEKETGAMHERPIIASVYLNRLRVGMPLQADPTVIYGIKDYQGKIRKADLLAYHPYNTYKIKILPPGPIASPGLSALRACLWPATSNYFYFVSRNDGTHVFCENLSCHNEAVRIWQVEYHKKHHN